MAHPPIGLPQNVHLPLPQNVSLHPPHAPQTLVPTELSWHKPNLPFTSLPETHDENLLYNMFPTIPGQHNGPLGLCLTYLHELCYVIKLKAQI